MRQREVYSLGPHGYHRIAYTEWGDPDNDRVVVCLHSIVRNGRDFDYLARALEKDYRVICPDLAGRGQSDWLINGEDYALPVYMRDMAAMIARLNVPYVDWVGTSLGGNVGMALAAQPNTPIRKLVLNDIGPMRPGNVRGGLIERHGKAYDVSNREKTDAYVRRVFAGFGDNLPDEVWAHMAEHSVRKGVKGKDELHFDPKIIAEVAKSPEGDIENWEMWDRIDMPVLILRGEKSATLTPETAQRMLTDGPDAELVEIPDCAHAPSLMVDDQIKLVRDWLLDN